jgi:Amiloride-sensitive sodium channel
VTIFVLNKLASNLLSSSIDTSTAVTQVCDSDIFNDIDPQNRTDCKNCASTLKTWMGSADQCFAHCSHIGNKCLEMFSQVVTESGVCFVYNSYEIYRNSSGTNEGEWTLEGGYRNHSVDVDIHPRRGSKTTLKVGMNVNQRMVDGICKGAIQGSKVYLHMPNEAP